MIFANKKGKCQILQLALHLARTAHIYTYRNKNKLINKHPKEPL